MHHGALATLSASLVACACACASRSAEPGSADVPARGSAERPAAVSVAGSSGNVGSLVLSSEGTKGGPRSGFRELEVEGFLPAVVYVPESATPRPLVVTAHGAGGAPEYECEYWRRLTRGRAFVLSLRGKRISNAYSGSYFYPDHHALGREFVAAVRALRAEFGASILPREALYTGFSQGAIMGAPMILDHGGEFPRLVLIEGGYEYWSASQARRFAKSGGKRVLFVCGTQWCRDKSKLPAEWLREARVEARIEYAPGAGHTPGGAVMQRTAAALPWITEGEPSWSE